MLLEILVMFLGEIWPDAHWPVFRSEALFLGNGQEFPSRTGMVRAPHLGGAATRHRKSKTNVTKLPVRIYRNAPSEYIVYVGQTQF